MKGKKIRRNKKKQSSVFHLRSGTTCHFSTIFSGASVVSGSQIHTSAIFVLLIVGNETVGVWGSLQWYNAHNSHHQDQSRLLRADASRQTCGQTRPALYVFISLKDRTITNSTEHNSVWEANNWWNEDWQGKPKYSSATLFTTNPTWADPGSNQGRRGEKPATNRLSYGAARISNLDLIWKMYRCEH
jgi:hypothetical protein